MSKTQRSPRHTKKRPAASPALVQIPQVVTPEGDPVVDATAVYDHCDPDPIRRRLEATSDFAPDPQSQGAADGALHFIWRDTHSGLPPPPSGERILALLTLTPVTLEVSTISRQRLTACRRRLAVLLGRHVQPPHSNIKTLEQVLGERPPEGIAPPVLPPELRAQMEDQMLHTWLDERIPALGGLRPREAVRTAQGRQAVLDLIDYITRLQDREHMPPSIISPDYRKAKKLLGL